MRRTVGGRLNILGGVFSSNCCVSVRLPVLNLSLPLAGYFLSSSLPSLYHLRDLVSLSRLGLLHIDAWIFLFSFLSLSVDGIPVLLYACRRNRLLAWNGF
ncbi:hypothetical protein C8R44DRAFT_785078 [Mycena epipterygia]|nr:hypothetical protein C8R44DRAFT_785078 [Mycena epipterygia]